MDIEELAKQLDVEKLAITAGNQNYPTSDRKNPDSNEDRIRDFWTNNLYDEIEKINQKIDGYRNLIKEKFEELKNSVEIANNAPKHFKHAASTLKTQTLNILERLKNELKDKKHDLEMFKNNNNLERSASYPKSQKYVYGVLFLILLAESILNGYVLSKAQDTGYFGGVFLALLVASINVVLAFMVGKFIFIQIWHISKFRRIACFSISVSWLVLMFLFNLGVAFARNNIDKTLEMEFDHVKFLSNPFNFHSFDSWLLLFLGVIFALIALWDGKKSDDGYFGYGDVDRQKKDLEFDIDEVKKELQQDLDEEKEKSDKNIADKELIVNTGRSIMDNHFSERDRLIKRFDDEVKKVKGRVKIDIKIFRDVNTKVREDPPPKYFSKEPTSLVFKKEEFVEINMKNFEIDTGNIFQEAKLLNNKEFDQLNTKIFE